MRMGHGIFWFRMLRFAMVWLGLAIVFLATNNTHKIRTLYNWIFGWPLSVFILVVAVFVCACFRSFFIFCAPIIPDSNRLKPYHVSYILSCVLTPLNAILLHGFTSDIKKWQIGHEKWIMFNGPLLCCWCCAVGFLEIHSFYQWDDFLFNVLN